MKTAVAKKNQIWNGNIVQWSLGSCDHSHLTRHSPPLCTDQLNQGLRIIQALKQLNATHLLSQTMLNLNDQVDEQSALLLSSTQCFSLKEYVGISAVAHRAFTAPS